MSDMPAPTHYIRADGCDHLDGLTPAGMALLTGTVMTGALGSPTMGCP